MGDGSRENRIVDFKVLSSEPEAQNAHSAASSLTPSDLQSKRQAAEASYEPSSKRSRKPSQKAKEMLTEDELEE
ncbi:glutathione-dependent formaldehyde-activating [Metarhizium brunneum]